MAGNHKPTLTRRQRMELTKKMERAEDVRVKGHEDYLVAISELMDAGLTGMDIAYVLGNITETTVHSRRRLGRAIRDERSGGSTDGPGEQ
jgi:hypothetical protein